MEKTIKYFGIIFVIAAFLCMLCPATNVVKADGDTYEIIVVSSGLDYKNSTLYYSDVTNKKICSIDQNTNEASSFQTHNAKTPDLIVADFDGNVFYSRVENYGLKDNLGTEYRVFGLEENDIGKIYDLDCDIFNNIYILCKDTMDNCYVLVKKQNSAVCEVFCELNGIGLDAQSKITTSLDKNFLVLFTQNSFYKVEENAYSELNDYDGLNTLEGAVTDIKLDYHNTLFILTNQKLYKSTKYDIQSFANDIFAETKTFELEYLSGEIFCVTNSKITKINSNNFVDSLSTTTIVDYTNQKYDCYLIKTIKSAVLYAYDNCIYTKTLGDATIVIDQNTTLCAIGPKTDSDFYFVLLNNKANENITGFIKGCDAEIFSSEQEEKTIKIVHTNVPLYNYPSKLDDSSVAKDEQGNQILLNKNTIYTMKIENFGSPDFKGTNFSQIIYHNQTYYVETSYYIENAPTTITEANPPAADQNQNIEKALTTGEIVGIILISITAVVGVILIVLTIKKNKKELD